jgi:CRP-like cAMP-binding protein
MTMHTQHSGKESMPSPPSLAENCLLAALDQEDQEKLFPLLEPVYLAQGDILYEPGQSLHYAYFPTTSIVSLIYVTEDGACSENAMIGCFGMVGVALFMGGETMPNQAVVQSAGYAYRLKAQLLKKEFNRSVALHDLLLRYIQALFTQIAQIAACNRHHSAEQRLCRWLLLSLDRTSINELALTHEMIAKILGVRREGITQVAGKLQAEGLIDYSRGHIEVRDRHGLEARSCECYKVIKTEYDRLLTPQHDTQQ